MTATATPIRKPYGGTYWTIEEIRKANEDAGMFYFSPDTLRFFRSRVCDDVFQGPGGVYFVTSEKQSGDGHKRMYSVRRFNTETAAIGYPGDDRPELKFQAFGTSGTAKRAAKRLAETPILKPAE